MKLVLRLYISVLVMLASFTVVAQELELDFLLKPQFSWKNYESENNEIKKEFLDQIDDFGHYLSEENLLNDLHLLDVNGDKKLDVVFDGWSGVEPNMTSIYLNTENGFKNVFQDYQKIMKLEYNSNKLVKLYIQEPGCCADPIVKLKTYKVTYNNSTPSFKKVFQARYIDDCDNKLPDNILDRVIKFEVINTPYYMRNSPEINNDPDFCGYEEAIIGNRIGFLSSGAVGYAIAVAEDPTGRVWWFSAFPPDTEMKETAFYKDEEEDNWNLGWISSRYIKKLKELKPDYEK